MVAPSAKYDIQTLFEQLRAAVKKDVDRTQRRGPSCGIEHRDRADGTFVVSRGGGHPGAGYFYLRDDSIVVGDGSKNRAHVARARTALTSRDAGLIRVENHKRPMDVSQFSQMVLGRLFSPVAKPRRL